MVLILPGAATGEEPGEDGQEGDLGRVARRTPSRGWQRYRRSGIRPSLVAARVGDSPEQPRAPQPASGTQQPPKQQSPPNAWEQACQQVAAFQRQHGRLPEASGDAQGTLMPGERPLGLWCTQQQRR
ncbi:hypothetical protein N2152v2_009717 [Parachlorella kessleri]